MKITPATLREMKQRGEKIAALTAYDYFTTKLMDEAGIEDGDLLLVRQQSVADEGDKVVALIDDNATVKEFRRGKGVVVLQPRSENRQHKPIVLTDNFRIQGVVVATIPTKSITNL